MNGKRILLIAAAVIIVALAAFWAGSAYATTGCFTDTVGNPYEEAICWLNDNGLVPLGTVKFKPKKATSREQAAYWLQQTADIPPSQGLILVSEGHGNWEPFNSADDINVVKYVNRTRFTKLTTGIALLVLYPSLPVVQYGRSLNLLGVEFCYDATTGASMQEIDLFTYTHTTAPGDVDYPFMDPIDRTDAACRYYVLSTPVTLTAEDGVGIIIQVSWSSVDAYFRVGRTTFVLAPTTITAASPSRPNTVILKKSESPNPALIEP